MSINYFYMEVFCIKYIYSVFSVFFFVSLTALAAVDVDHNFNEEVTQNWDCIWKLKYRHT